MAPRVLKPESEDGTAIPKALKPKTEKAKVEKVKTPKVKAEKAEKPEKAPKVVKPKAEKADKAEKKTADKGDGKVGDKAVKEKVKAVTGEEAEKLILEYLRAQNRPFSATEVSANLHGKVTKTVADKLLKEMGEAQKIGMNSTKKEEKGSQFVFWALQDPADAATPEELAAMDTTITMLKSSLPPLKSTLKITSTKLATLKSAPTTSELQTMVDNLRAGNATKAEKLNGFKNGEVKQVSKEEMARVEKEYKYWDTKKRARKLAYMGLEDMLLASGERMREDIRESLGVEND